MKNDTGVIIVTYQPNRTALEILLNNITQQISHVVLINNGEGLQVANPEVKVRNLKKNRGIAFAQNVGVEILREDGISYCFFLDQDSELPPRFFSLMLDEWDRLSKIDPNIGLLSPLIQDKNFGNYSYPRRVENGRIVRFPDQPKTWPIDGVLPISSGILVSLKAFHTVGGISNDLFIDWVDFQLDFRLIAAGFTTYTTNVAKLQHAIGQKEKHKFFGKTIYPTNYPIFREYYFARNAIILMREFKSTFPGVKAFVHRSLRIRFLFILFEDKKFRRFWTLLSAIKDGYKYELPD